MSHEDKFETFALAINPPLIPLRRRQMEVRPLPRFLDLVSFKEGESFTVTIPTARRTWWIVGTVCIVGAWFMLIPVMYLFSWGEGSFDNRGRYTPPDFMLFLFNVLLALLLAATWYIARLIYPRITITANHDTITVHNRAYAFAKSGGFRIGYSLGGVERVSRQGFYGGFRISYGTWGDDLPFMVRHYYAPAYVIFLNDLLQAIEPQDTPDKMAESGIKTVLF